MCDFVFDKKEDRVKSIFALYPVFLTFATPIKIYFDVFFTLLPYVVSALEAPLFCECACKEKNAGKNKNGTDITLLFVRNGDII